MALALPSQYRLHYSHCQKQKPLAQPHQSPLENIHLQVANHSYQQLQQKMWWREYCIHHLQENMLYSCQLLVHLRKQLHHHSCRYRHFSCRQHMTRLLIQHRLAPARFDKPQSNLYCFQAPH